ncbi:hypothetical protein H1R20_g14067, partial [Candolleomyces eurysporus]
MAESPPVHVEILSNARNVQIGELKNTIVNGNQYISSNDQATALIQLLRPILDASHTRDRETSPPNSACFPGTRTDVIRAIVVWADSTLLWNTHVLWLYGFVGCGKSAIALAIALKFERRNRLVGSFFFFRNTGDRSRMVRFATTLAFQLAAAIPEAAPFIKKAVTEEGLPGSSLVAQLRRLVYEPFKAAAKRVRLLKTSLLKGPFLIVIDGLDECEDRQEVQAFIDDMLEFFKKNPLVPLRFFITSRVEQHIQRRLEKGQVRLENLVNHCSRGDIDKFMHTCFEAEKLENPVVKAYIRNHGDWPAKKDKDQLVDHIGGSFIFASALFKYIVDPTDEQSTPMDRLPHTLNMNPGLDTLYAKTLSRSHHLPHFSDVISTLALTFEPLPIIGIAELLGIECFEVVRVLVNLQAIIHIPGTDDLPVTIGIVGRIVPLKMHEEQATALQRSVQRVEAAIRAKGLGHHLKRSWDLNVNKIHMNTSGYWTALGVYQVLKWIFAHAEVDTNPAGPGVGLYITEIRRGDVKISIRPFTQPSAT